MIDFYYFSSQCPYNVSNKELIERFCKTHGIVFNHYNIDGNRQLAKEMNMFSPTLTVFDKSHRWTGPLTEKHLTDYLQGILPVRDAYIANGSKRVDGKVSAMTKLSLKDAKDLCSLATSPQAMQAKETWIFNKTAPVFGALHYVNGSCVAGVEFMNMKDIPYHLGVKEGVLLTCVFGSDRTFDYKSAPLAWVEAHLREKGHEEVYVVASKEVSFPNGPLEWFLERGYEEVSFLYHELGDYAKQYLLKKQL